MKSDVSKVLIGAVVAGLVSGSLALAKDDTKNAGSSGGDKMSAEKNGCKGKSSDQGDSNSDEGTKKSLKKDKQSCSGPNGCGG